MHAALVCHDINTSTLQHPNSYAQSDIQADIDTTKHRHNQINTQPITRHRHNQTQIQLNIDAHRHIYNQTDRTRQTEPDRCNQT